MIVTSLHVLVSAWNKIEVIQVTHEQFVTYHFQTYVKFVIADISS